MPKSPEQYQPSEEEIKKAEDMMTPEQKELSKEREEAIEYGRKEAKEELDLEKSKEKISEKKKPEAIKPKEKISRKFTEQIDVMHRTSFIDGIKNSAFLKNVEIGIDETKKPMVSSLRIKLRGNRDDIIAVMKDIEHMKGQIKKNNENLIKTLKGFGSGN
ncbi:MAG TPA: hypothetical protein QF620_02535 [Candidatus Paceibacterota bacterium]|jgi:ribosomal protein S8|nr:hypothetical protein [Parcubacteria group bacterium]MDP7159624.1 hypothetical protein [Candidatus Paceibacterota bacterium]MDP7367623.1 hypothetical protein [Candidatus Paceibacterota bacterium]MDP7648532.1 hypothetical protein [Candidatus Paceibacterota bacterium]HJO90016.1 hypothetical protein [Candidatus Paceibacterota bacterium]|tara:strand:- start:2754 stop:3233 length:480 start_codon:yes stop_codon:yes gene_type:complete